MKPTKVKGFFCEECGAFHEQDEVPEKQEGWVCESVEQVTFNAPQEQLGMACPHCDVFIVGATPADGKQDTREVCEHCEDDETVNEHEKTDVWELSCECPVLNEPEIEEFFQCSECEEVYEERDEARDCCKE